MTHRLSTARRRRPIAVAALLTATVILAGCGVRGAPQVPPPMFGPTDLPPGAPQPYPPASAPAPNFPESLPPQTDGAAPNEG